MYHNYKLHINYTNLGLKVDICFQDVFKEVRMNDNVEVKSETEVHVRSRRLPITRKFYAFYHAPIVKFWFNTVCMPKLPTRP